MVSTQKKPDRILVGCNKEYQQKIEEGIEAVLPELNDMVQAWDALGLGNLETEFLRKAMFTPRELFKETCLAHLPEETIENVGPFARKKEKTLDGLILPDASSFIAAADKVQTTIATRGGGISIEQYEIIDGEVKVKDLEAILDKRCRTYVYSPIAKEFYDLQTKFINTVSEIQEFIDKCGVETFMYDKLIGPNGLNIEPFFEIKTTSDNRMGKSGWITVHGVKKEVKTKHYSRLNKMMEFPSEEEKVNTPDDLEDPI